MSTLIWILISTIVISLIAFVGILTLFFKERFFRKILLFLVALSAGALMGGAFLHLIPEAIMEIDFNSSAISNMFLYLILGFSTFFVLEQFIHWHHHHACIHSRHCGIKPFSYLILIGDAVHNFIDGLVIAGSFVIGFSVGIVTSIAIALHEIPQEIGDFGVLVYGGFKKKKALLFNFLTAITAIIGGIVGFYLTDLITGSAVLLLPFAAGNFIYIASSDLVPEIKHEKNIKKSLVYFLVFLIGIAIMFGVKLL